jgi:hypothetical protein
MKEITTPTIAPSFKNKNLVLEPIITETKTTQGDSFFEYILKQPITIQYTYSEKEYEECDKLPVKKDKEGFYMLDGYRCHVIEGYTLNGKKEKTNYLPVELFEVKQYAIVREYKSTVWEIK